MKRVLAILALVCGASAVVFDFLQPKELDGISRVEVLDAEEDISPLPLVVVFISNDFTEPEAERLALLFTEQKNEARVYLSHFGILPETSTGEIYVFRNGRRIAYHGLRDALTIAKFVRGLVSPGYKKITGKVEKIAFDKTPGTKLVGYFTLGSTELITFEAAANLFGAQVSFYIVTDPIVAKHLKLTVPGQINLLRDFDRHPIPCPVNPASLADIQQLIVFNRQSLVKVTPMNALDPLFTQTPGLLLITNSDSVSYLLLNLVAKTQRNLNVSYPRVLWVDVQDFPGLALTKEPIGGLASPPGLGFIDPSKNDIEWLDMTLLNKNPADKIEEEVNMRVLKQFLVARFPAFAASHVQADVQSSAENPSDPKTDPKSEL